MGGALPDSNAPGPASDAQGNPVFDPSSNVFALVNAAILRVDDLRIAEGKRQDDLREAEAQHVRDISALRAEYQAELRSAETQRIDAIRAVDVGNVQRAAEVQATQAQTLASQVATSAETLRAQQVAADIARRSELAAALEPIQKDIADLRRAQYEAQGQKTQVVETRADTSQKISLNSLVVAVAVLIASVVAVYISTRP